MIVADLVDVVLPRQIERVRRIYGDRAAHMISGIERMLPSEISHTSPDGGMFLWLTLPEGIDTVEMLPAAVARHVAYVPGRPFYALGGGENTMRLSFSCADADEIDRGLASLAATIHDRMG